MGFAKKLRDLRERKGLTQQELAEIIKVSTKTISRYESGQTLPRYRAIYDKLSETLDTNHDYLVTDEDDFKFKAKEAREKYSEGGLEATEDMINGVIGLMAGGEIPEEDKRTILDAITEAYYIAKAENTKNKGNNQ